MTLVLKKQKITAGTSHSRCLHGQSLRDAVPRYSFPQPPVVAVHAHPVPRIPCSTHTLFHSLARSPAGWSEQCQTPAIPRAPDSPATPLAEDCSQRSSPSAQAPASSPGVHGPMSPRRGAGARGWHPASLPPSSARSQTFPDRQRLPSAAAAHHSGVCRYPQEAVKVAGKVINSKVGTIS